MYSVMTKREFNPGSRLMRARQRRRLTRKDAARRLSLGVKDVKALDQWRLQDLPPHINVKKTIRQYALMVGQNPSHYEGYIPPKPSASYKEAKIITFSRTSVSLIGILVALVAGGFIAWRTYVATASPYLEISQPVDGLVADQPKLDVSGRTSERAQVIINGINTPVSPDGSFRGEAVLKSGPNTIEVRAINSFGRESLQKRTVFFRSD